MEGSTVLLWGLFIVFVLPTILFIFMMIMIMIFAAFAGPQKPPVTYKRLPDGTLVEVTDITPTNTGTTTL